MLHFKSFSPKWGISPNLHSLSVATLGNKTSPMNIRSDCPLQSQVHLIGLLRIYKNKVNRPIYFYLSWQLLGTHLPHDLHSPLPPLSTWKRPFYCVQQVHYTVHQWPPLQEYGAGSR